MTTTTAHAPSAPTISRRDALATGLLYLGLGITGILGFLLIRPQLFAEGDPSATLANLLEHEGLARAGIALQLGIVVTQALTALWFYRLFRPVDSFAAGSVAVFGLGSTVAHLGSAAFLATALDVALDPGLAPSDDGAATTHLMYVVSDNLWGVGATFFGLWLIPMGWLVLRSGWMPRTLGWLLIAGGVGYVLSTLTGYLAPDSGPLAGLLTAPATIGEFWMIGALLVHGMRRRP